MTTAQIIFIVCLCLLEVICFFGVLVSKKYRNDWLFGLIFLFGMMTFLTILLTIQLTQTNNNLIKSRGKCPEYEKVENVYRLKE